MPEMMHAQRHGTRVERIRMQTRSFFEAGARANIYHGSTNLTRRPQFAAGTYIDVSALCNVLEVNAQHSYALVEPNVPMDTLVDHTLAFGLLPPVVMEFPGITVGGGVQGTALESSSFKYGSFHDSCLEYEIVLANGEVVAASPHTNRDLFHAVPGSYGSLGILTLAKLRLIPASRFVRVSYKPAYSFQETVTTIRGSTAEAPDFVDGLIFSRSRSLVIEGRFSDSAGRTLTDGSAARLPLSRFRRAHDEWYYIHADRISRKTHEGRRLRDAKIAYEELVPIRDYLFRYDRGAFWMGHNAFTYFSFTIPFNRITRTVLNFITNTRRLYRLLHETNVSWQYMIQDVDVPLEHAVDLLEFADAQLGIYPLWVCPWRPTVTDRLSPNYIKTDMVMNVGIWGKLHAAKEHIEQMNRELERTVTRLRGRKMLYAHTHFSPEDFWSIYDRTWYEDIRRRYYAAVVFPDLYEKVKRRDTSGPKYYRGILGGLRSLRIPVSR